MIGWTQNPQRRLMPLTDPMLEDIPFMLSFARDGRYRLTWRIVKWTP